MPDAPYPTEMACLISPLTLPSASGRRTRTLESTKSGQDAADPLAADFAEHPPHGSTARRLPVLKAPWAGTGYTIEHGPHRLRYDAALHPYGRGRARWVRRAFSRAA